MIDRPEGFIDAYANRGVCGVVATAIAAGVSYEVAKATLKKAMHSLYPDRQRMRGATTYAQRKLALSWLAVIYSEHVEFLGMSVESFAKYNSKPNVTYMICFKGHVFTLRNGIICDQSYNGPVENWYRSKRQINRPVIEIEGVGW